MSHLNLYDPIPELKPAAQHVGVGRDPNLESQLVTKSRQPHILKFTPNDAGSRFSSTEAIEERARTKKREYYWLIGPEGDLGGIAWFGPKTFPLDIKLPEHPTDTFALRLYENYVGKGLAAPFFKQAMALETIRRHDSGESTLSLWLETDEDNPAAHATYAKIGFRPVHSSGNRTYMVMTSAEIGQVTEHIYSSKTRISS